MRQTKVILMYLSGSCLDRQLSGIPGLCITHLCPASPVSLFPGTLQKPCPAGIPAVDAPHAITVAALLRRLGDHHSAGPVTVDAAQPAAVPAGFRYIFRLLFHNMRFKFPHQISFGRDLCRQGCRRDPGVCRDQA